MSLWTELKRRNVVKVGAAYLAVAWLVTQVVSALNEPLKLPEQFDTIVVLLLAVGLPIALVIAWAFELTPEGIKRTDDAAPAASAPTARSHTLNYVITGVLALAVAFLLVDRFVLDTGATQSSSTQSGSTQALTDSGATESRAVAAEAAPGQTAALTDTGTRISVAVLPFRTLAADQNLAPFANGLSEQLIRELKRIPELLVVDRAASFAFRDSELTVEAIAGRLGVAHVLSGSIASDGEKLRITADLTRAADDSQLFTKSWDFAREDIFAIQDEITGSVATALSVSLGVLQSQTPGMTQNVEAYDEFLQGLGGRQVATIASLRSAELHFQRAVVLDPEFLGARLNLYFTYRLEADLVPETEAAALRAKADETLALARSLAPEAREIEQLDAIAAFTSGNWIEAAAYLARQRASGNSLEDGTLATNLGLFLYRVGRVHEAIDYLESARAMNPLNPNVAFNLGSAYAAAGDIRAALAEFDRILALVPDYTLAIGATLIAALASGDREELERRIAQNSGSTLEVDRVMPRFLDDRAAGLAEVRRRHAAGPEAVPLGTGMLAHWANYYGAPDIALDILLGLPSETGYLPLMLWDPGMARTRALPEFKTLVTRLGFVSYWREYGWPDFCHPIGDDFACE